MERKGGFTNEDKFTFRKNGGTNCQFPDCSRPNTGIVNHITGCYEGRKKGVPLETLADINMNAILLCRLHTVMHDIQEQENIEKYAAGNKKTL